MATALTAVNRESELSYAYLHAIASHAGVNCKTSNRHDDNAGIDAMLTGWEPFPNGGSLTEVDIKVQLKASIKPPFDDGDSLSYFLSGTQQYDDLRRETHASPRILAVLFLPPKVEDWLTHSNEQLVLRKCAYWVSLRGSTHGQPGRGHRKNSKTSGVRRHRPHETHGKHLASRYSCL